MVALSSWIEKEESAVADPFSYPEKADTPSKNRVGDFFGQTLNRVGESVPQVVDRVGVLLVVEVRPRLAPSLDRSDYSFFGDNSYLRERGIYAPEGAAVFFPGESPYSQEEYQSFASHVYDALYQGGSRSGLSPSVFRSFSSNYVAHEDASAEAQYITAMLLGVPLPSDFFQVGGSGAIGLIGGGGALKARGALHHIATNKNLVRGGAWTKKFQPLFKRASLSLKNSLNKVRVPGHFGPHPQAYHQAVYRRLIEATRGLRGDRFRSALIDELGRLGKDVSTPGHPLNKLITK